MVEVLSVLDDIFDTFLKALSDPSDEVVLLVLDVHTCIARDAPQFRQLVVFLVHKFWDDHSLLEKRGALIIRRLCVLLDAEQVGQVLGLAGQVDAACSRLQSFLTLDCSFLNLEDIYGC